ncbi:MAG TPA: sulfotransferase [Acidimicrobiia bacterium]|nr:sulfotransferase [Acidimicrobiia bacterium]
MDVFPLFVGSGRSGTTMFGLMFDSHPDLAIAHEAHFIPALAMRDRSLLADRHFDHARFLKLLYTDPNYVRLDIPRGDVAADPSFRAAHDYATAVRSVMSVFARSRGKRWYGDKTPGYVIHLDLLARLFPEAKFIHIIRDGRDVALGYVQRPEWGPHTVAEAAFYWRSRVSRGQEAGKRLGSERYREVRYEAFVEDPAGEAARLCEFLGISFAPQMLTYYERGTAFAAASKDPQAFTALSRPPTKGLRDWRKDMRPADLRIFEHIAGHQLAKLGYETGNGGRSPITAARLAIARVGWQTRRINARLSRLRRRRRDSVSREVG